MPGRTRLPEKTPLRYIVFMRALLVLVLSLSIPLQGVAGMLAPTKSACPMEHAMQAGDMAADDTGASCCNDAATFAKTGKPCKTGQQCPTVGIFMAATPQVATPPASGSRHIPAAGFFVRTFDPSGVWRPPTPV